MNLKWCCSDFEKRILHGKPGLGVLVAIKSRVGVLCMLEYRRNSGGTPDSVEDGFRLKFCPWCGRDLVEWSKAETGWPRQA